MKTLTSVTTKGAIHRAPTSSSILSSTRSRKAGPFVILLTMLCAILLMDAILQLRALWFHEALLTQLGTWPAWPSQILFPGWAIIPPLPGVHITGLPDITLSWLELPLLLGAFVAVFLVYIVALRRLPERITRRYVIYSTLLLGFFYILIPVVTSPDLYSYIAYARIGVLYHLNPLTTPPSAIPNDAIYSYVAWTDQPSAYGPTWAILTSAMQGIFSLFGFNYILPMVIMLRLFGLLMHLLSTVLIWSISGHLLRGRDASGSYGRNGFVAPEQRMRATLAFAWNPLLLLEACVNAHNDATVLFFVLLAIWFLVRHMGTEGAKSNHGLSVWNVIFAAAMLAFATSLKLYIVLFAPGLLFYLWMQGSTKSKGALKIPWGDGSTTIRAVQADTHSPSPTTLRAVQAPPPHIRHNPSSTTTRAMQASPPHIRHNPSSTTTRAMQASPPHIRHNPRPYWGAMKIPLAAIATYIGVIVVLYAPFWQGGAIFDVFSVNPATYRSINSLPDFLAHLYNAVVVWFGFPSGAIIGSPAEHLTHTLSVVLFVLIYCMLGWRILRGSGSVATIPGLIGWMAMVWLLFCIIGSPWFWPWYIVTFFGLYAVIEAISDRPFVFLDWLPRPLIVTLLSFSMLSLYCFVTWGPRYSNVPGLPGFRWAFLGGLWIWAVPLLGVAFLHWRRRFSIRGNHPSL